MSQSGEGGNYWSRLGERMRRRYRLSLSHADDYKEVWGVRLTRLNVLVALGTLFLVVLALSFLLIFFSPLRHLIPVNLDPSMERYVVGNALRADSMSREVELWDAYLSNLRVIFSGGTPDRYFTGEDSVVVGVGSDTVRPSSDDSLLRVAVEERLHRSMAGGSSGSGGAVLQLRRPVEGEVSSSLDVSRGHLGTDIVAAPESAIVSVADGTVIGAQWTSEYGYVITIQHLDGLVSVYKHNSRLLRRVNDRVRSGDAIAIIGSTGEQSTGLHLHLELWRNGEVLNAEHYLGY